MLPLLLLPSLASAQDGGDSGAFLRLGMGVRALSMGGAFTAVADDGAAMYWNPAGVGFGSHDRMANLMYRVMAFDRRQVVLSYTQGIEPGGGVGFVWYHVGVDDIDGRNLNGQRTGTLSDSENAVLFSFSPKIHDRVSVGVNMKLLIHRLAGQSARGFGGDIGVVARPVDPLRLGLMFRDVGTRVTWDTEGLFPRNVERKETYPRALTVGVAYRPRAWRVLFAVDAEAAQRRGTAIRVGADVDLGRALFVRSGLNDGEFAAGTGLSWNVKTARVTLHYMFLTDETGEHDTHGFEWEVRF